MIDLEEELAEVRDHLGLLIRQQFTAHWCHADQAEFDRLAAREQELLDELRASEQRPE